MRPTLEEYFSTMLSVVASRATCPRRKVGAIVTDEHGQVLSTGYNGVPRGIEHCLDQPCPGAQDESGDSTRCEAVHAEVNALIQCADITRAHTLYVSVTPCFECAKAILNTPIRLVVVLGLYNDKRGLDMLTRGGVQVWRGTV